MYYLFCKITYRISYIRSNIHAWITLYRRIIKRTFQVQYSIIGQTRRDDFDKAHGIYIYSLELHNINIADLRPVEKDHRSEQNVIESLV